MSSIKYSAPFEHLAGHVRGTVFQRGRVVPIMRCKSTFIKTYSGAQIAPSTSFNRGIFSYVSQQYRAMTSAQFAAWSAVLSSFPRYNKYGTLYYPTVIQLFTELNYWLVYQGFSISFATPAVSTFTDAVFSITGGSGGSPIIITQTAGFSTSPYTYVLAAGPPQSQGLGYRAGRIKQIKRHQFTVGSPAYNINADYLAAYNAIIPAMSIWFSITQCNKTTGEKFKNMTYQLLT